jgi:hypothetical protein
LIFLLTFNSHPPSMVSVPQKTDIFNALLTKLLISQGKVLCQLKLTVLIGVASQHLTWHPQILFQKRISSLLLQKPFLSQFINENCQIIISSLIRKKF